MTETTATATTSTARETWLQAATEELRTRVFAPHGHEVPEVSVSIGFPGGGSARTRIGECWVKWASADERPAIFISPTHESDEAILATLTHELVHAMGHQGHGAGFRKVAVAAGLAGKMTATHAGEALVEEFRSIIEDLGPSGHARLKMGRQPKQSTRMLKVECLATGYKVRMTAKWLEEYGAPKCACCDEVMSY